MHLATSTQNFAISIFNIDVTIRDCNASVASRWFASHGNLVDPLGFNQFCESTYYLTTLSKLLHLFVGSI